MDRDEALRLLKGGLEGAAEWNQRRDAGEEIPDLHGAGLRQARLGSADLRQARLGKADLRQANLHRADLHGADLRGADLRQARLSSADLRQARLGKADLRGAHLHGADLREADLRGAHLGGADLRQAHLGGAHLRGAHLGKTDLRGADLRQAHLGKTDLRQAHLGKADLRQAHRREADLRGAHLRGGKADLRGADLTGADLRGADLTGADLTRARLIRCQLDDALFDDVTVTDCHFQETIGRPRPPVRLRIKDHPPLTGEDAWNFFNPPAIVEVDLTAILSDQEIGVYHFHLGDVRSRGVGTDVYLVGIPRHKGAGAGTVLRFQAPTYAAIYDILPVLLAPFRMSRAVDWPKTYESLPDPERGAALTGLAPIEAEDLEARWPFAARMAEVFGNYRGARIAHLRDGRHPGVPLEVATHRATERKLARQASRWKPVAQQQIIYLPAGKRPRIALEDHVDDPRG
jgi:uncharacterized protein YjbI with pentapeptide repeats